MLIQGIALTAVMTAVQGPGVFTIEERAEIVRFWNEPGRYQVIPPPDVEQQGLWRVRTTVAGSTWLWNLNRARGLGKNPTIDPRSQDERQKAWDAWIDAKVARDRWEALQVANDANRKIIGKTASQHDTYNPTSEPPPAGPIPQDLLDFVRRPYTTQVPNSSGEITTTENPAIGVPPPFAEVVVPMAHRIRYEDGQELTYLDNARMRPKYAYYRFEKGTISAGQPVRSLPAEKLNDLFERAGVTPAEARVMRAVSILEGGFDSVNTYDTGWVSVGFIQFATLAEGGNSVGKLLQEYKQREPASFSRDFKKYGIDSTPWTTREGKAIVALVCIDPETGTELVAQDASRKVIEDKRLISVFQRAGLKSDSYNAAQIRAAKTQYYPGDDMVDIGIAGISLRGKVSDFIKSEAGMATLMDRKVNTGRLDPLPQVLQKIALEKKPRSFADFAKWEKDIVLAMKYRKDYLADTTLSQPK